MATLKNSDFRDEKGYNFISFLPNRLSFFNLSSTMDNDGELSNDWELLHNALPPGHVVDPPPPVSGDFHGVDGDSEGVVQPDYLALDSDKRSSALVTSRISEENGSTDSDNPSWIDPGFDHTYGGDGKAAVDLGMSGGFWSDFSGDESVKGKTEMNEYEFRLDGVAREQVVVEGSGEDESAEEEGPLEAVGHAPAAGEGGKRCIVWWKLPFELLKFYAFRIGPVWSLSIVAAALGLVILGRKLYMMKRRARRFRINMGVDDKVRLAPSLLFELVTCASIYFLDMIILFVASCL